MRLFEKAGRITAEALAKAKKIARPGGNLEEFAEEVESFIKSKGAAPAFPVNIGIDCVAAHYTPSRGDAGVFPEKGVVKIDVGAQVDGYCGDSAATIDFGEENGKLVEASEAALEAAISAMKAGVKTNEVGQAIETEIRSRGFKPIENLTGHAIKRFTLHAGTVVPNVHTRESTEVKEGEILAVEPFASTGKGRVGEGAQVEIFSFSGRVNPRLPQSRKVQDAIEKKFPFLPFAERWLYADFSSALAVQSGLKELAHLGGLRTHPVLSDARGSLVSQAEHTLLVESGGCRVLTRL